MWGASDHDQTLKKVKQLYVMLAYSDANWAGSLDDSRFTTDYAIFFYPNLVS